MGIKIFHISKWAEYYQSLPLSLKQLVGYFCAASVSLVVNLIARFLLNFYFSFGASVVISYLLGLFVNFYVSNKFVFSADENLSVKRRFVRFSLVACVGLIVAYMVSQIALFILIEKAIFSKYLNELFAHICGIIASFVCNFLGHKFFSFKHFHKGA